MIERELLRRRIVKDNLLLWIVMPNFDRKRKFC